MANLVQYVAMIESDVQRFLAEMAPSGVIRHRDKVTQPIIDEAASDLRRYFRRYVNAFLAGIKDEWIADYNESEFVTEALRPDEWQDEISQTSSNLFDNLVTIFSKMDVAYTLGARAFVITTDGVDDLGTRFDTTNPRAVSYLRDELFRRIVDIDDETKRIVDQLVSEAVRDGVSYTELARRLRAVSGYDNSLFGTDKNGRDRADRIAIYEVGDRYENGNFEQANQIGDLGLTVMKKNLTAGDSRVSDNHLRFESQGFIPLTQSYDEGQTAPFRPNCRCTTLYEVVT